MTPAAEPAEGGPLPDEVTVLVDSYTAGQTIRSLVAQWPYGYRAIRTALLDAGVTLRPPQILLPPTPPGMVNAYVDGQSVRQLARTNGLSYSQTRNILLSEGVELRKRGGQS